MGTNNPSEEQMELVTARVIEIAQSLAEEACMLEAQGYFDECGFDLEARGAALTAKLPASVLKSSTASSAASASRIACREPGETQPLSRG